MLRFAKPDIQMVFPVIKSRNNLSELVKKIYPLTHCLWKMGQKSSSKKTQFTLLLYEGVAYTLIGSSIFMKYDINDQFFTEFNSKIVIHAKVAIRTDTFFIIDDDLLSGLM